MLFEEGFLKLTQMLMSNDKVDAHGYWEIIAVLVAWHLKQNLLASTIFVQIFLSFIHVSD